MDTHKRARQLCYLGLLSVVLVGLASWWFLRSLGQEASAQGANPADVVQQFFPQALISRASQVNLEPDRDACFVVYDNFPDGTARTIIAAYAEGAMQVIQRQSGSPFGVVFELRGYLVGGENCSMKLVDLNGDGTNEVFVSFRLIRSINTADWYFRWDGLQLVNLGPTALSDIDSLQGTVLGITDRLDLDHDGVLEIIDLGEVPPRIQDETGEFTPDNPKHVYKILGGTYVVNRALVYYGFFLRETGEPRTDEDTIDLAQEPLGDYVLKVINGKAGGSRRVSSARIVLNGVEILSPQHFSQQVEFLNIPITLQRHNTIEVTLAGTPLGEVIITIEDTSAGAPSSNP